MSTARAAMRRADRARPGGQRRSPHKPGRRSNLRSPYWTINMAMRRRWLEQLQGGTTKQKRRWFRRAAEKVLHPVAAMRRRETSPRAAFQKGRPSRFQRGQR